MKRKVNHSLILWFITAASVQAQSIKNIKAFQGGEKIEITYDLEDTGSKDYFIRAYASNDHGKNFGIAIADAQGDVNTVVKPGPQRKITWNAVGELGEFQGMLRFKIVGLSNTALGKSENKNFIMGVMDVVNPKGNDVIVTFSLFCKGDVATTVLPEMCYMLDNFGNRYKLVSGKVNNQSIATAQSFKTNQTTYGELNFVISKMMPSYKGASPSTFMARIDYEGGGSLVFPTIPVPRR